MKKTVAVISGAAAVGLALILHKSSLQLRNYPVNTNQPPVDIVMRWQYPTNIITLNYWWDLQSSTDMVHWTVVQSNVGPGDLRQTNGPERVKFFRMRGHL